MNPITYRYPLDPTGSNPDNLVEGEEHQLSNRTIRVVAPKYQGFYAKGVIITDIATNVDLIHGTDYAFGELYKVPTGLYEKEIFGVIVIRKLNVSAVKITYQCLGGNYSYSMDAVIAMLDNLNLGNRPVAWADIIGKPTLFDPASHFHDIGDIFGFEYVVNSLEGIRSAILIGDVASHDEIYRYVDKTSALLQAQITALRTDLTSHVNDVANPHQTTKAQVGLGSVIDYGVANQQQMDSAVPNAYATPSTIVPYVQTVAVQPMVTHINNLANPHQVTKAQVGLGLVWNMGVATQELMDSGSDVVYATPNTIKRYVEVYSIAPLYEHVNDVANPHRTTKAQVGLSNVDNFATATFEVAQLGISNNTFMTPQLVRAELQRLAITPIANHLGDVANPHQTTKAQVGLGSVENYPIASAAEFVAGSSSVYPTPRLILDYIGTYVNPPIINHINDRANPHGTTASQVGLGNVWNFGVATQELMNAGVDYVYTTPNTVVGYVNATAIAQLNNHTGNFANPHQVTKAQVGLGSVNNYPMASIEEMDQGISSTAYVSPTLVSRYVNNNAIAPFNAHIGNFGNPHQVTAAQVGLGNVSNYVVGSVDQFNQGRGDVYATPYTVQTWIGSAVWPTIANHVNNGNNPHGTTAAQVGLGNVYNFGLANQELMNAGVDYVYTTPSVIVGYVNATAIAQLNNHAGNTANPHQTTKAQVGLGSVQNYDVANNDQFNQARSDLYATPYTVQTWVNTYVWPTISNHVNNGNNPHGTTAAQVGLGNVNNFGVANQAQMNAAANNVYTTPSVVWQFVVDYAINPLNGHINNTNNPHGTTAAQVGLGSVQNLGVANQELMNAGVGYAYATPEVIVSYVNATAIAQLNNHAGNTANPHQTTKAQVGLGNVSNFAVANQAQMNAGTGGLYVTPDLVTSYVNATAIAQLNGHTGNTANPHQVTKAQVGLSEVVNFGVASQEQMNAVVNNVYTTPSVVANYINQTVGESLRQHLANLSNPHGTTKAQVGLPNVDNFPTSNQTQFNNGASTVFVTPNLVHTWVNGTIGVTVTNHINNGSNPHGTTAAQVGLGNVRNLGSASIEDSQVGYSNDVYMTPYTTRVFMDAQFANYFYVYKPSLQEVLDAAREDRWVSPAQLGVYVSTRLNNYYTKADVDYLINQAVNANQLVFTNGNRQFVNSYSSSDRSGEVNYASNYFDVYPPAGKTMSNLKAFIPSSSSVYFAGTVDKYDTLFCQWEAMSDRIRVWVGDTEQRSAPAANWLAAWR